MPPQLAKCGRLEIEPSAVGCGTVKRHQCRAPPTRIPSRSTFGLPAGSVPAKLPHNASTGPGFFEDEPHTAQYLLGIMAVNHADGMMFASVIFYPIVAAKAAVSADAGWLSVMFVPAGLTVGIAVTCLGRKMIYAMMEFGLKRTGSLKGWAQQVVGVPMLLLYFVLPLAIAGGGIYGTWLGSIWVVRRIL